MDEPGRIRRKGDRNTEQGVAGESNTLFNDGTGVETADGMVGDGSREGSAPCEEGMMAFRSPVYEQQ